MSKHFEIDNGFVDEQNSKLRPSLDTDYDYLAEKLWCRNINIEDVTSKA